MKLGEWFVEIVAKGLDKTKKDLDGLSSSAKFYMQTMHAAADETEKAGKKFEGLGKYATQAADKLVSAMKYATASVTAFAAAGLVGTYEGEQLTYQFQQLSRQIAAVFLPVIQSVTNWISKLVSWFRSLSAESQDFYMKCGLVFAGMTLVVGQMQKYGILIPAITMAWKGLMAVMSFATLHPVILGFTAIAAAIGLVVYALQRGTAAQREMNRETERIKTRGLTDKQMSENETIKHVGSDAFKSLSKEDQLKELERARELAEESRDKASQKESSSGLSDSQREHFTKTKQEMEAELRAIETAQEQIKEGKTPDFSGLKRTGADRRDVTPKTGGFEAITSTYSRLQESAMSRFDPAAAEEAKKQRDKERDQKLERIATAVETNKPGGMAP